MVLALTTSALTTTWVAIILRAAMTATRAERMFLAAIAASCVNTVLYNPYVADWLNSFVGFNPGDLTRHTSSIITATVMVSLAIAPTRPHHIKWWTIAGALTLAAILLLRGPAGFTRTFTGTAQTSDTGTVGCWPVVYYVLLGGYCVAALAMTIVAFLVAAKVIAGRFTKVCLRLICISFVLKAIPWVLNVGWLITSDQLWIKYIPAIDGFNAMFLAAALVISLGGPIAARIRVARTVRRIRPLWAALTQTVPDVVLKGGSKRRRRYDLQRIVIELRDCILILGDYIDATDIEAAQHQVDAASDFNGQRDAVVAALSLQRAQANKMAGSPPAEQTDLLLQSSSSATLGDDLAELIRVADAYRKVTENNTIGAK